MTDISSEEDEEHLVSPHIHTYASHTRACTHAHIHTHTHKLVMHTCHVDADSIKVIFFVEVYACTVSVDNGPADRVTKLKHYIRRNQKKVCTLFFGV